MSSQLIPDELTPSLPAPSMPQVLPVPSLLNSSIPSKMLYLKFDYVLAILVLVCGRGKCQMPPVSLLEVPLTLSLYVLHDNLTIPMSE